MTRSPLLALAALAVSGSIAFAQTPPPPAVPATPPAPVERRPAGDAARGMEGRDGHGDFRRSSTSYHGRPDEHGFHGPQGGGMMEGGFHIAPPGMWWKSATVVQKLTLTPEQTKKMDDIFQAARLQLIDLHANVEKQNVLLEPMLSANPPDTVKTLAQIDKVAQARADLEKADAKMLLGIRGVLTPDQWTKLRSSGPGHGPEGASAPGGQGAPGGGGRGPRGRGGDAAPQPQP